MQQEKKQLPSEDQNTQELLRRLREQYESADAANDDSPEDIFDVSDVMQEDEAEDDELTRRIAQMFASDAALPEKPDEPDAPADVEDEMFDTDEPEDAEDAEDAEDIEDEAVEDLPEEELFDEVSDQVLTVEPEEDSEEDSEEDTEDAPEQVHDEVAAIGEVPEEQPQTMQEQPEELPSGEQARELPEEIAEEITEESAEESAPATPTEQDTLPDQPLAYEDEEEDEVGEVVRVSEASDAQGDTADVTPPPQEKPTVGSVPAHWLADDSEAEASAEQAEVTEEVEEVEETENDQERENAIEDDTEPEQDARLTDEQTATEEDEVVLDEFEQVPLPTEAQQEEELLPPTASQPTPPTYELSDGQKQVKPRPSPLDAALAAQRKKHQAEGGRHSSELRAAENLSENDVALLLRLGYENDLRARQGEEVLRRIQKQARAEQITDRQRHGIAYGYSNAERDSDRSDPRRDARIRQTYKQNATALTWRLVLTLLFASLLVILDLMPLYASVLPAQIAGLATHPVAHFLALQLLLLCAVPSGKRLIYGVRQLLRLTPEPICILPPVLVINLLYDVIMAMQPTRYALLNAPTALLLVLAVLCDRMDLKRERASYDIVSASENKTVLSPTKPHKKKVLRGGRIVKIIDEDAGLAHYTISRAEHIDGYFERTNADTARYRYILPLIAAQLLLSVAVAGISTLSVGLTPGTLTAMLLTMQICAPVCVLCMYSYSLSLACRSLNPIGATILGQRTVDEMNRDKLLIFADTDMLQAKSSTEITIKGSGDSRRYVRSARRIFSTLGGTLGKIITSVMAEERMDGLVEILRVYPQGLEARLDGRVHVLMGSSDFMRSNAISVPSADAEMLARRSDDGSILYVAFGGQIRLGYEINYRIYKDFEQMAAQLAKGKTAVAIRSADPNITEDYLAASRVGKKTPIRLYKPIIYESRRVQESESSGIVSTGKIRSVARAIRMCEHIAENERSIVRLQWATLLCGAALAAVMTIFGNLGIYLSLLTLVILLVFALPIKLLGGTHLTLEPWADDAPSGKASTAPSAHRTAAPTAKGKTPTKHK